MVIAQIGIVFFFSMSIILHLALNFFLKKTDRLNMNNLKENMIRKAMNRYKNIAPCAKYRSLEDCFTVEEDKIYFWFNTEDKSTHVLSAEM
jgi:hypothetical protein